MLTCISRGYLSIWKHVSADPTQRFSEGIAKDSCVTHLEIHPPLGIIWNRQKCSHIKDRTTGNLFLQIQVVSLKLQAKEI